MWNPDIVDVDILLSSSQIMHLVVTVIEKQVTFHAAFVYAFNYYLDRVPLWRSIQNIANSSSDIPWIIMGDFNVVRHPSEIVGGKSAWPPYMEDLNTCCFEAQLDDLKFFGHHLTWDNRGHSGNFISRKLDRVLSNSI